MSDSAVLTASEDPLVQIDDWPVDAAGAAWVRLTGDDAISAYGRGDKSDPFRLASVTKPLIAFAVLIAIEEQSIDLDQAAGPPGSTVRHLMSHASGLDTDTPEVVADPGSRRIYSNAGFEVLGEVLEAATGFGAAEYLRLAVCEPLGMKDTVLDGSPAHGAASSVRDLILFIRELMMPTLLSPETLDEARSPQFPALSGVLPGFGVQEPNLWGLGFELKGTKHPHWTAPGNSRHTFGHFGAAGTMLWVDPVAGAGCVALTNKEFGPWAQQAWPAFSSAVLTAATR